MTETLRLAIEVDASKGTAVVKEFTGTVNQAKTEWSKAPAAAQGPLAQFNAQMRTLQQNWQGVAVGAGIVAGGVYVAARAIGDLADAAAEAEQIESRMAFQIEQVGYLYNETKVLIDDFADSTQRATRFSDEMARQGLGQMMQYTTDLNQGMQGLRLAMDMSTQTGQGLESTIRYVGMAMNGNAEILGRWIPELRDLDSKLGANATSAEKAAYAIGILNEKFSGASQADLENYAGRVQHLKNQWDDTKEAIGKAIVVPGLENWLDWIDLAIEGAKGLGKVYDWLRAQHQSLLTGESARNILIRERGEELKRLAKAEQAAAEKARELQLAKKEVEDIEIRKALRAEQERIDIEYQTKYFALAGDRIAVIEKERDQALQVAWQKGLRLVEIERYYNELILAEKKRGASEAQSIMSGLGIKTEAGAQAEIVAAAAQYEKLLKSGLFTPEQIEAARLKIVEKLRQIQADYSNFFGEVSEEFRDEEGDLKVRWTQLVPKDEITRNVESMVDTVIQEMDRMTEEMGQPRKIQIDDSAIGNAIAGLDNLEDRLNEIVSRSWKVNLYVMGYGSTEKPILEKIEEVQNAFQTMGSEVGNMVLQMNLSQITKEISELEKRLYYNVAPIWASDYMKKGIEVSNEMYREQIADLKYLQKMLIAAGSYTPESGTYGGGGGEVSININTINVIGGSDMEIAQKIDAAIAELIYKDRSKIKQALFS